uniref:Uncharacterized protein n=1 Tax=Bracon brevicornis TaxID=1563983 RepID=A0A6V7KLE6_9HYME
MIALARDMSRNQYEQLMASLEPEIEQQLAHYVRF